ncbi:hypothetical protein DMA11_07065 [Marinilabiliaceae bacterium JC017]|nr:hypothetical protein DMA11_07065 [Marinilabiliaceae bacterium JC017]
MVKQTAIILFLVYISLSSEKVAGQGIASESSKMKDVLLMPNIPSIDTLIQHAVNNSGAYKYFSGAIKIKEQEKSAIQKEWMNMLSVEGRYGYGMYDQILVNELGDENISTSSLMSQKQKRYYIGLSLDLPLSDVFQRKNRVKIADLEIEKAKHESVKAMQIVQALVVEYYYELLQAYDDVIIKSNQQETMQLQLIKAKKEFNDGQLPVNELARIENLYYEAQLAHKVARHNMRLIITQLELLTGIKIIEM